MEQIKQQLQEKLGLSPEVSEQAVTIVLGFIKERMPEQFQGIVDEAIQGKTDGLMNLVKEKLGGLGGLLG